MTTWILIRHGESTANLARRLSGWHDVELTKTGVEQARAAGELIAHHSVDRVISSDLRRAAETARHAIAVWAEARGAAPPPLTLTPALRERDLGSLQGKHIDTLRATNQMSPLLGWDTAPPGGESLETVITRSIPALLSIDGPGCVAVFAHGGVIRGLMGLLSSAPLSEVGVRKIPNATPIFVELGEGGWGEQAARHGLFPR
ncbi:MAG: histidine phosphatase family protein [Myxococcota bacterium]|nr:histidine phosphatase family protein [Myxococcota bacterium]